MGLAALLLVPAVTPLVAAAPAPSGPSDELMSIPPEAWDLLTPWLLEGRSNLTLPSTLPAVLDLLAPAGSTAPAAVGAGWEAYFAAYKLDPTPEERALLARFQAREPALARQVEALAVDLARAALLRERAFAALTPADWDALPGAMRKLAAGGSAPFTTAETTAIAAVDARSLAEGAALLTRAALAIRPHVDNATAHDKLLAEAIPTALRDPASLRSPSAALDALAEGAAPVTATMSLQDLLLALQSLGGVAPSAAPVHLLPRDLHGPLANLLEAYGRTLVDDSPEAERALLATLARDLDPLTRAATNLTAMPAGALVGLSGAERPLSTLSAKGRGQPAAVLRDMLGEGAAPAPATLPEGYAALRAAFGRNVTSVESARLVELEAFLGPDLAAALGTVLRAQADYRRDLAPDAPLPSRTAQARLAAAPILSSGDALTVDDVAKLQAAAGLERELRRVEAARALALLEAILALHTTPSRQNGPTALGGPNGVVFDEGGVLVLDGGASIIDEIQYGAGRIMVLDLGGDDVYRIPVAGVDAQFTVQPEPTPSSARTSVAVDLGGNDRYESARAFSLGAALGGPTSPAFAMLFDASGDDVYRGGDAVLGWGYDAIGIAYDASGDDNYEATGRGLAGVGTTEGFAVAAGILVDVEGNDAYRTGRGYASLDAVNRSTLGYAVFLDVFGNDKYAAECPRDEMRSCFASPRFDEDEAFRTGQGNFSSGHSVFIDGMGEDKYPREGVDPDFERNSFFSLNRMVYVGRIPLQGLDADGDLFPNEVDPDPANPDEPSRELTDRDEDGFIDVVESLFGTDSTNASSRPVGLPGEIARVPVPDTGHQSPRNLLLDVPDVVAIGLPGPSRYETYYALSIDLGAGEEPEGVNLGVTGDEGDLYLNATAHNGIAVDLGGDDTYAPRPYNTELPAALGAVSKNGYHGRAYLGSPDPRYSSLTWLGVLVDLAGDDRYTAGSHSQGASSVSEGLAVFLDAGGEDRHHAPAGTSQGYATTGGRAYFLDLGVEDDDYLSPTQGYSEADRGANTAPGRVAYFLDAGGADTYDSGPIARHPSAVDAHQGRVTPPRDPRGDAIPSNSDTIPSAGAPVAAFFDLGGDDRHWMFDEVASARREVGAQREERLRLTPLDGGAGVFTLEVFLDVDATSAAYATDADADDDGVQDVFEIAAGTNPRDKNDATSGGGYSLRLPRLGLGIGDGTPTTWPAKHDYALALDTGGVDAHLDRAGASTHRFPAALLLDMGPEGDVYESNLSTNLSAYATPRLTTADPITDMYFGGAQGAGILGIGVLVDEDGANRFSAYAGGCGGACNYTQPVAGVFQGAGFLGVGVLAVLAGDADFRASVDARVRPFHLATAHTISQGAGVGGVGVLAKDLGRDTYVLEASATGIMPGSGGNASGQGYGLHGIGVLLDTGGDNVLSGGVYSQGAASEPLGGDMLDLVRITTSQGVVQGSQGLLLLAGPGRDTLVASARSQAYAAGAGALGLLYDADGDDRRTLNPPGAGAAWGQAAATAGGTALLLDQRGNDRSVVNGTYAQGVADRATAYHVDLAGNDVYRAFSHAMAMAHPGEGVVVLSHQSSGATLAVLLDRVGNDVYGLLRQARGLGGVTFQNVGGGSGDFGSAAATFIDSGGFDLYENRPAGHKPVEQRGVVLSPRTYSDNDWSWNDDLTGISGNTGGQSFNGAGVDDNSFSGAYASVITRSTATRVSIHANGAPVPENAVVSGDLDLRAYLGESQTHRGEVIDRVEFLDNGGFLGLAVPATQYHNLTWHTARLGEDGLPLVPDGTHAVEALLYPRAGSPANAVEGRGAAVDAEPFRAAAMVRVDNPPVPRTPAIPENVSTALPVVLPVRVDRDLDRDCAACLVGPPLEPGADDFALPPMLDVAPDAKEETPCVTQCSVAAKVHSASGVAHLTWTAPQPNDEILGYRVSRELADKTRQLIGFVDARVTPKALPNQSAPAYWLVDATPGPTAKYLVAPVKRNANGELVWSNVSAGPAYVPNTAPGPVTGLRAAGNEDRIDLAWRAVPGATSYIVSRSDALFTNVSHASVATNRFTDVLPPTEGDRTFTYRVTAMMGGVASTMTSLPVSAKATPGHRVDISLEGANVVILNNVSLGGDATHAVEWDASAVPDGEYVLKTVYTDGAARSTVEYAYVRLDGTPPATSLALPGSVGGPFLVSSTLRVPFAVGDSGTGINQTAVYFRLQGGEWTRVVVNSSQGYAVFSNPRDGARLDVIAVSADKVGNLEGLTTRTPWTPTFDDAFRARLAAGAYSTHLIDTTPPSGTGAGVAGVYKPGDAVTIEVRAGDSGTGVSDIQLAVGATQTTMTYVGDDRYVATWTAQGAGRMQVFAVVSDAAGNTGRIPLGALTVDADAPTVSEALVTFPGGRTLGRPGETATLRVTASDKDDITPEGRLAVTADVANASTLGKVNLRFEPNLLAYVGTFPVNRLDTTGKANLTLTVEDGAGHRTVRTVVLRVNGTPSALGEITHVAGSDRITVSWTTAEALRARVDYGLAPQLGQSSALTAPGAKHAVELRDLRPDTLYYAKAVVVTDAGVETFSPLLEIRTGASLDIKVTPVTGLPHSAGDTTLRASVKRFDGVPSEGAVDAVLEAPRGAPRVAASGLAKAGDIEMTLDLVGLREGAYTLTLDARDGDLRGRSAPIRLILDRTAPLLELPDTARYVRGGAAVLGAPVAQGALVNVRVEERGSGIDLDKVEWTFDGGLCAATLSGDTLSCRVPPIGREGDVTMTLRVPDRSGNVAEMVAILTIDGAAPTLKEPTLGGGVGLPALRPGGPALLSVEVTDVSIQRVVADLRNFGGVVEAPLRRVGDRWQTTFTVPGTMPEGAVGVRITAEDATGLKTTAIATSHVDGRPAGLLRSDFVPQGSTTAIVIVETDEPTRLTVRAVGPAGEKVVEDPTPRRQHALHVRGLVAGAPIQAAILLVDDAGHTTASSIGGAALPDFVPPTTVTGLRLEDRGDGRVTLRWGPATDDAGIAGYRVTRTLDGESKDVGTPLEATLADEIPVGATVRYTVVARDYAGNEGPAATVAGTSASVPRLAEGSVFPPTGGPGIYAFKVTVTDASGKAPAVFVRVNGVAHPMTPDKDDCREGCVYEALVTLEAETLESGPHRYQFETGEGAFPVRFPDEAPFEGPAVLHTAPSTLSGVLSAARNVPALGFAGAALALAAVVALAVLFRRRRQ